MESGWRSELGVCSARRAASGLLSARPPTRSTSRSKSWTTAARREPPSQGSSPARILGLKDKGHLGPGADADVTVYTPSADRRAMFELPRFVIKGGELVVEQGEVRQDLYGKTLHTTPGFDEGTLPDIRKWFESYYTIQFANYPVDDSYLHHR